MLLAICYILIFLQFDFFYNKNSSNIFCAIERLNYAENLLKLYINTDKRNFCLKKEKVVQTLNEHVFFKLFIYLPQQLFFKSGPFSARLEKSFSVSLTVSVLTVSVLIVSVSFTDSKIEFSTVFESIIFS